MIIHPDVTTVSDLPHLGLCCVHGQKTVILPNGKSTPWRYAAFLAAFHRRRHSCAPTIATGHCRTARDHILASGAPQSPLVFNDKRCCLTTHENVFSCLCRSNQNFLLFLSSCLFLRRSTDHRRIIETGDEHELCFSFF